MGIRIFTSIIGAAAIAALGAGCHQAADEPDIEAPLLDGMGSHHHEIKTDDPLVQRLFDQGLVLSYGFNHKEAERSFREAARLDPECAMCWWGVALVLGPNINLGMPPEHVPKAWEALEKAQALKQHAGERHRAYIDALAERYEQDPPDDRGRLDEAYADAMGEVAERYPDDPDAATLYGEALMDTTPWDYWEEDGSPKPVTRKILATLESVLAENPDHPGANHLYIHAVEAQRPEQGLAAAKRLEDLVPGAGHLVHMPSHIYIRTGDYHAGSLANERAVKADEAYIAQCRQQGVYPLGYVPHNWHFLWATATLEGRSERALEAARETRERVNMDMIDQPGMGTLQHFYMLPLYAKARFARWDEVLDAPQPPGELLYPQGVWHYARGMAYVGKGELDRAQSELENLRAIANDPGVESVTIWEINTMAQILAIADDVLSGELAAARGNNDEAIRRLRAGVAKEDSLSYNEPPDWHSPVRLSLGTVLMAAGRADEAEGVYRENLKHFPENGWALYGLAESLEAQGKAAKAKDIRARFEKAWRHADIELDASRLF